MTKLAKLMTGAALAFAVAAPAAADELTVVSFGGAYGAAQYEHMIKPFEEATGHTVLFEDYSGGIAEVKAQVEAGNVQWDVVDFEVIDLERACSEGLVEYIDFDQLPPGADGTPADEDFFPQALENDCGVGIMFWGMVYAYNTETIGDVVPETIADFFDTAKIPGKRAMRRRPQVNLEWALMADGVAADDVYEVLATEEGQKRAFAKLSSIADDIVWYDSWSQAPQLLNDGGAILAQAPNGRMFSAIKDDGAPFSMVWDSMIYDLDVWSIVAGTDKLELATEFVNFATSTEAVAGMQDVAYGPTRRSSGSLIDPDVANDLPTAHIDEGIKADGIFWADYGETLGEQFNEWLLQQ